MELDNRNPSDDAREQTIGDEQKTHRFAFPTKTLFLSSALPPEPGGQAFVLYRWLESVDPTTYQLLSFTPPLAAFEGDTQQPSLRAPLYRWLEWQRSKPQAHGEAAPNKISRKFRSLTTRLFRRITRVPPMMQRLIYLIHMIRRDRIGVVVTCSGNPTDIPVAVVAGAVTGTPIIIIMFDEWIDMMPPSVKKRIFQRLEGIFTRRAVYTIVSNEKLAEKLIAKFNVPVTIVRNATDRKALRFDANSTPWPRHPGQIRLLYAGSLTVSQRDSLQRIDQALNSPRISNASIDIHIANEMWLYQKTTFSTKATIKPQVAAETLFHLEREADILVIPLGFNTPYPDLIQTAAPSKFGEFLASGRPILVHAPANSWVIDYVRQHDCGIAIDQPDVEQIVDAILEIANNPHLRERITRNARTRAMIDFNPDTATQRIISLIQKVSST